MRRRQRSRRAWLWVWQQLAIFALFVGLTLANEVVDVPFLVFGDPQTPFRRSEVTIEIVIAACVVTLELAFIARLRRRLRILEGLLPICAACKKIRLVDQWEPLERYLVRHSMVELTHSICEDCERRLYPELVPPSGADRGSRS